MSFFISDAIAEAAPAAAQPDPLASLILPIGLVVLFYFFLIRPQLSSQLIPEPKLPVISLLLMSTV